MGKKTVSGTTKQPMRGGVEKKAKKSNPPRLSEDEKKEKYGKTNYKINFKPLTQTQEDYYNSIMSKRITFGTGVAGSGKSFVCLTAALELLKQDNTYKQILILTPTVESGNMNLGFLPGSREEKIQPYLEADYQTIKDILDFGGNKSEEIMKHLLENELVIGDAISFMRGKTLKHKIVIITEAENFSKQEMMLLLSRISPTSKYIINGDNRQQDRKDFKNGQENGLKHAMDTLKDKVEQIGFCHFLKKDIVRDPLIEEIMDAWFVGDTQDDNY